MFALNVDRSISFYVTCLFPLKHVSPVQPRSLLTYEHSHPAEGSTVTTSTVDIHEVFGTVCPLYDDYHLFTT